MCAQKRKPCSETNGWLRERQNPTTNRATLKVPPAKNESSPEQHQPALLSPACASVFIEGAIFEVASKGHPSSKTHRWGGGCHVSLASSLHLRPRRAGRFRVPPEYPGSSTTCDSSTPNRGLYQPVANVSWRAGCVVWGAPKPTPFETIKKHPKIPKPKPDGG